MITSMQIRAARSALDWTAAQLASYTGIASRTILRIENADGVPQTTTATLSKIQTTLEAAGIEFIGTPSDAPGIRIHAKPNV
jgi:transcriptional regulator with XRE-family HTH domain